MKSTKLAYAKRASIFDFKLDIARAAKYELLVVSFKEANVLDGSESYLVPGGFTIFEGIIARLLVNFRLDEKVRVKSEQWLSESEEFIEAERNEYLQDQILTTEVSLELECDPIAKAVVGLQLLCDRLRVVRSWGMESVEYPPAPNRLLKKPLTGQQQARTRIVPISTSALIEPAKRPRRTFSAPC